MRVVLKVGSNVLSYNGGLSTNSLFNIVELISEIKNNGDEVILVSSGAVSTGYSFLQLDKSIVANRQALASIGQPMLLNMYQEAFHKFNLISSQVLLSADVFSREKDIKHAKNAIETLLENNVIPIINENDTVTIDELVFGDNDMLSAHVTHYFDADLLVILSDIDGYYDKDPKNNKDAIIKSIVTSITEKELSMEVSPGSEFGTGGIVTKLKAADFLMKRGKDMYLTSGKELFDSSSLIFRGRQVGGTLFKAYEE